MLPVLWGGVLAGSLASFATNPHPSVGISGGLFALVGALLAVGLRHRRALPPPARRMLVRAPIEIIVLNLALGLALPIIDNAAHLGGLAGGVPARARARACARAIRGRSARRTARPRRAERGRAALSAAARAPLRPQQEVAELADRAAPARRAGDEVDRLASPRGARRRGRRRARPAQQRHVVHVVAHVGDLLVGDAEVREPRVARELVALAEDEVLERAARAAAPRRPSRAARR